MNKAEAMKLAKRIDKDGYQFGIRHYGKGSWSVEINEGRVFHTVEAYDNWSEAQRIYAAQAEADRAMYAYDDEA